MPSKAFFASVGSCENKNVNLELSSVQGFSPGSTFSWMTTGKLLNVFI